MVVLGILLLGIVLLAVPVIVGESFTNVDKSLKKLPFAWISGQCILWAGFQLMCVPMILLEKEFSTVVWMFSGYMMVLLAWSVFQMIRKKNKYPLRVLSGAKSTKDRLTVVLWGLFWGLLVFQLIMAVCMTYGDGDDAFYVAVSNITEESNLMYRKLPYTGMTTQLDARHGMAPFPIWIAYLAKISKLPTVSVAHVAVPLVLIPMTYAIFYLIGSKLFGKGRSQLPLFLVFTELLVLFGDYSFYTAENFMIARSRQGKAALGSIIIPMLFLLLMMLMEKLQENKKISFSFWLMLAAVLTAACLCSTLGALLVCMLAGVAGICGACCYRKWKFLIPMVVCCVPCVIYAGLYLVLS